MHFIYASGTVVCGHGLRPMNYPLREHGVVHRARSENSWQYINVNVRTKGVILIAH